MKCTMTTASQILALGGLWLLLSLCSSGNPGSETPPEWPDQKAANLVVMSYNTRHAARYSGSSTTNLSDVDIPGLSKVIKEANPDVVLLQEIDSMTLRNGEADQMVEMSKMAGYRYVHFFRQKFYNEGAYGAGIMSKYPLKNIVNHNLPKVIDGVTIKGSNILGTAEIEFEGKTIRIATTHLSATASERKLQFPYYLEVLTSGTMPTIVGGDFNSIPDSDIIRALDSAGYKRTNSDPTKLTIPSTAPTREIDYIAFRPDTAFSVMSHTVISGTQASDHLPIISVLKMK